MRVEARTRIQHGRECVAYRSAPGAPARLKKAEEERLRDARENEKKEKKEKKDKDKDKKEKK